MFGAALAIIVIAIVVTAASPETVGKRQGIGDALVSRIGVPSAARTAFARTAPGMIGTWMSAGLILGLGASIGWSVLDQYGGKG
ncbi:hypothetical protein [Streptomyces sp. NPDC004296]|uniref:hypothetical protein n=1 Tax=Streptomyces sp. NPDC004296 TaxID=3364697 RepID=UPI00368C620D